MNIFCILANKKQHNIEEFASQYEVSLTVFTIAMVISIFCIYLSWTCNTIMQTDTFLKIIYAFFCMVLWYILLSILLF
jgi:hypothetical protein